MSGEDRTSDPCPRCGSSNTEMMRIINPNPWRDSLACHDCGFLEERECQRQMEENLIRLGASAAIAAAKARIQGIIARLLCTNSKFAQDAPRILQKNQYDLENLAIAERRHGAEECRTAIYGLAYQVDAIVNQKDLTEIPLPRPAVWAFAEAMESALREHDEDRGPEGWIHNHPTSLLARLRDEAAELDRALIPDDGHIHPEQVAKECADVANFAMMIFDLFTPRPGADSEEVP